MATYCSVTMSYEILELKNKLSSYPAKMHYLAGVPIDVFLAVWC